MPESKNVAVFSVDEEQLTTDKIQELKDKFGLEIRIRSTSTSIDKLLNRVASDVVAYDRTHPGYDRIYDRDPNAADVGGAVINPADIATNIGKGTIAPGKVDPGKIQKP
ncbi:hypothetical protein [Sorangium sp. So ce1389]|uniref:hypothetical protein n=1 Tax=Sorangium sp. So ce1389 TaxID=3133336 RepID=UPI003F62F4B9